MAATSTAARNYAMDGRKSGTRAWLVPGHANRGKPLFEILREDFGRYYAALKPLGPRIAVVRVLLTYGFIAVCVYRYGRWAKRIEPRWLSLPFKALYVLLYVPTELIFGIRISVNSDIGPGLYIAHFGGIFLRCQAGRNLTVLQDVTIGSMGAGKSVGWPVLGSDIFIGAGAKLIGDISIGDGVVIGANTVVTKDIPAGMRVVGAAIRVTPMDDRHEETEVPS